MKKIEIVEYNPNWPKIFETEKTLIEQTLGGYFTSIHHIGSTAVPGLCSKPKIDILVTSKNFSKASLLLGKIGYLNKGEINIPFHLFFAKKHSDCQINLHLYEEDMADVQLNLLFRDYLRSHAEMCLKYANLKWSLISDPASQEKSRSRFTGYNLGKDLLIKEILVKAGFEGLCLRFCMHTQEEKFARRFQEKPETFERPDHRHFILYLGVKPIGYAHIELFSDQTASIRLLEIDDSYKNQDFEKYLQNQCLRWLKKEAYSCDIQ